MLFYSLVEVILVDHTTVLVSGACGTIGRRLMRVLGGMNIPALAVGYSGKVHRDIEGKEVRFTPLLLLDGPSLEERLKTARGNGISIQYKVGDYSSNSIPSLSFDTIAAILDANAEQGTGFALDQGLYPQHVPLLVQGGTKLRSEYEINPFVSVPQSRAAGGYERLGRAKHVSCNTTWLSTCVGLMLEGLGDSRGETIRSVDIVLQRRFADTEEGAKQYNPDEGELKPAEKYGRDVAAVLPQMEGKIHVRANKNPWRQFHYGIVDIEFDRGMDFDAVHDAFAGYSRAVLLERNVAGEGIQQAINGIIDQSKTISIPDGDIMLPIYTLEKINAWTLRCIGFNPQRSIVLPGTIDWIWKQQGPWERCEKWSEAFQHTNDQVEWYGLKIPEIKKELERRLPTYRGSHLFQ